MLFRSQAVWPPGSDGPPPAADAPPHCPLPAPLPLPPRPPPPLTSDCLCFAGSFLIRTCLGTIRAPGFFQPAPTPQPRDLIPAFGPLHTRSPPRLSLPSSPPVLFPFSSPRHTASSPSPSPPWLSPPPSTLDLGCFGSFCPCRRWLASPLPPPLSLARAPPRPSRSRRPHAGWPAPSPHSERAKGVRSGRRTGADRHGPAQPSLLCPTAPGAAPRRARLLAWPPHALQEMGGW